MGIENITKLAVGLLLAAALTGHLPEITMKVRRAQAQLLWESRASQWGSPDLLGRRGDLAPRAPRILASFAATIHLAEVGLSGDAGGCARTAMEAHFFLRKCCLDPEWADKFIKSDLKDKESYINELLGHLENENTEEEIKDPERLKQRLEEVSRKAKEFGAQEIRVKKTANSVGLGVTYSRDYRALSQRCTHITPGALQFYLETDENNVITGFKYGPDKDFSDVAVFHAVSALRAAIEDVVTLHKIDLADMDPINEKIRSHFDAHAKMLSAKSP